MRKSKLCRKTFEFIVVFGNKPGIKTVRKRTYTHVTQKDCVLFITIHSIQFLLIRNSQHLTIIHVLLPFHCSSCHSTTCTIHLRGFISRIEKMFVKPCVYTIRAVCIRSTLKLQRAQFHLCVASFFFYDARSLDSIVQSIQTK